MRNMAHFIYANELTSLKHGYPLWEPDCDPEVSIADVGYIRHGQFCRLFNASLPKGHPANQEFGEPDGYEPIHIGAIQERAPHPPGVMASRSVSKQGADVGFSGSILEAGAGFHFSCKKNRGAILIINSEANRKDALRSGAFKVYLIKHYKSWLRLANNEHNARDVTLGDLVFVTGHDLTADWAVATFKEQSLSGGISFEAGYPVIAGAQFSIWGSWKQANSMHSHCGPRILRADRAITGVESTEDSPKQVCAADLKRYDQCIFLRGFRILDRKTLTRRKISIMAKDNSNGLDEVPEPWFQRSLSTSEVSDASSLGKGRSGSDGGSLGKNSQLTNSLSMDSMDSGTSEVQIMSDDPQGRTHIDALLEYILEKSTASIAVAHDDDLAGILQTQEGDEYVDIDKLIRSPKVVVHVDLQGVGTVYVESERLRPEMPSNMGNMWRTAGSSPAGSGRSTPTARTGTPRTHELQLFMEKQNLKLASSAFESVESLPTRQSTRTGGTAKAPSSAAYHAEQEGIRAEIDELQVRLAKVQERISLTTKTGRGADRRNALHAELEVLRERRLEQKAAQDLTSAELKTVQDEIRQKVKNLQGISKKLPAKTTAHLDEQIRKLEAEVDTGTRSLSEEKATLRHISGLRRSRAAVENSQALQADIDAHRARANKLQSQMGSGLAATSARMATVREELEALRKESETAFAERGALYGERAQLQTRLSALHEQRRQSTARFMTEREEYRRKADEERAQMAAQARAERAAREEQQRIQARERLLEKARAPAFATEIRDCRSLIEYFSSTDKGDDSLPFSSSPDSLTPEEKPLLRQSVETSPGSWEGWIPLKKKTEESYFVGGKGKAKKSRKSTTSSTKSQKVSVPIGILLTLVSLSIPPPAVATDIPRTIEELRGKVEWFEANQTRVTEENVIRAKADLQRIGSPMRNTLALVT